MSLAAEALPPLSGVPALRLVGWPVSAWLGVGGGQYAHHFPAGHRTSACGRTVAARALRLAGRAQPLVLSYLRPAAGHGAARPLRRSTLKQQRARRASSPFTNVKIPALQTRISTLVMGYWLAFICASHSPFQPMQGTKYNLKQSNSNLLTYLGLLLSDDAALSQFLVDPITESEEKHGLTKAERSVLRRTVAHLSNNSVNGYAMARHLKSYRRSLRLLQNVLHNVGSKMVQDTITPVSTAEQQLNASYTFSVIYNLPNVGGAGPTDFTCKTNADVDLYGGAYAWATPAYAVTMPMPNPTIRQVMDEVNKIYFGAPVMPYTTVPIMNGKTTEPYVKSLIPLGVYGITADLSNPNYDFIKYPNADYVFWFYSINGTANPITSGGLGESFNTRTLNPNDTVYWQLIAPDKNYGFLPCK